MWINTETLDIYRTPMQVKLGLKNVSFAGPPSAWPDQFSSIRWEYGEEGAKQVGEILPVTQVPRPTYNDTTHDIAEGIVFAGGEWTQTWTVFSRSAEDADDRRQKTRVVKTAKLEENLQIALDRRTREWQRTQFPQVVAQANKIRAQLLSSQKPEEVDITIE